MEVKLLETATAWLFTIPLKSEHDKRLLGVTKLEEQNTVFFILADESGNFKIGWDDTIFLEEP